MRTTILSIFITSLNVQVIKQNAKFMHQMSYNATIKAMTE